MYLEERRQLEKALEYQKLWNTKTSLLPVLLTGQGKDILIYMRWYSSCLPGKENGYWILR